MILYHNTTNENALKIEQEGIKIGQRLDSYKVSPEEGNVIWAINKEGAKGYGGCTIAFYIDDEEAKQYQVNDTDYTIPRDIPAEDIQFIDYCVWTNGGEPYRISDISDLIKKFGVDKVINVISTKGSLYKPFDKESAIKLVDDLSNSLTEGITINLSNKQILTEARMKQLVQKTRSQTPALADRSDFVNTDYIGISKFGIFNFRTTSQTHPGSYWYQTIEIPDLQAKLIDENITPDLMRRFFEQDDIKVYCDDPSFLYWAFKYMAHSRDYGIEPETRAPQLNNVRLQGALCKHLLSVMDYIQSGQLYEQMAKDATNWLAYMSGNTYKNFNKARMMGDANKKKNRISWENYDSYMNDYFASKAGINKFLDDEDIKNSLKAEIERTAKTDPSMTLDDFISDEFGVEGIQGLANELQIDVDYIKQYFKNIGF